MINVSDKDIVAFQKQVLTWYVDNKRDLPWRKTTDPYRILISEVMLQQTQVDRVIGYYERWIARYPDFSALAKADKKELLALWSGLGYNSRALRLQQLALVVCERFAGTLPTTEEELRSLPGIGPYTAHAVLAFAYNKPVPVMDTNIRRVLIVTFDLAETTELTDLQDLALRCIPSGQSCVWHNALMDYGALEMTARKTGVKPLSKQSRFAGSDRAIRGALLKLLLKDAVAVEEFGKAYKQDQLERVLKKDGKGGTYPPHANTY